MPIKRARSAAGLATTLLLLTLGCRGAGSAVETPPAADARSERLPATEPAGEPVRDPIVGQLRFDETLALGPLELRWLDLADSRCPRGVTCVWEGEATVAVEVLSEEGEKTVELTLRSGAEPGWVAAAGHELRLLAVEPHPRHGVVPDRVELLATIALRALEP